MSTLSNLQQHQNNSNAVKRANRPEMAVNAPMFLKKTYTMIDTCNPTIGCWDQNGLSFIIKNSERFAAEVIPEFFKHNNLSSFVRQLNFYGFRKIKNGCFRFTEAEVFGTVKILQFRHDMFRRDRPDLLPYIKKHAKSASNESQEVASLKIQIQELRDELEDKSREMDELRQLVEEMAQHTLPNQQQSSNLKIETKEDPGNSCEPSPTKKQKLLCQLPDSAPSSLDSPNSMISVSANSSSASLKSSDHSEADYMLESYLEQKDNFDGVLHDGDLPSALLLNDANGKIGYDEFPDCFDPIGELEAIYREQPGVKKVDNDNDVVNCCYADTVDPILASKISMMLSSLPNDLQHMFVDRFVALVSDPNLLKSQTDTLQSLANLISARNESTDGKNAVPTANNAFLAASALETYLLKAVLGNEKSGECVDKHDKTTTVTTTLAVAKA